MKALDRLLQRWRIGKAGPYIRQGDRVLDIGCSYGELFRQFEGRIDEGVGIDDDLDAEVVSDHYQLIPGTFPEGLANQAPFHVITMLAVLEHVPRERQPIVAKACYQHLLPGGHLVITTPEAVVDHILDALTFLRLIDGMSLEEHYGFEPNETPGIFTAQGLTLVHATKFQLGLNNVFVFPETRRSVMTWFRSLGWAALYFVLRFRCADAPEPERGRAFTGRRRRHARSLDHLVERHAL